MLHHSPSENFRIVIRQPLHLILLSHIRKLLLYFIKILQLQYTMVRQRYEGDKVDTAPLGKPLKFEFSGKSAQNRFMKGAMSERLSSWDPENPEKCGVPTKTLINVYKRWGEGEYGVILTGNVMIELDQLEAPANPIIPRTAKFEGERFESFKALAKESKAHGSLIVAQVSHPGRQVADAVQPHPISASDIQLEGNIMGMTFAKPKAATQEDIDNVIEGFAHSAEYLEKAGYDGIQLHGAHGYLLSQFLSNTTNKRSDKYGGSLENRSRIIMEIIDAVRARTSPSFIVGIKLNSVEFQGEGFDQNECKELCATLESRKTDFVELSGGTYEHLAFNSKHQRESTKKRESFFLEFAEVIVPGLKSTKTYVTGGFHTAGAMVEALNTVDGVGLARAACSDPTIPKDILEGKYIGATKNALDQNDFGSTNFAAGTQIRQIGNNEEPVDLSDEKNVETLQKDMKAK
jgi:2,4-dienoyl-CoA reductase-like NADH-dependent reductase (Old Yellow Enzyme family)